MQLLHRWSVLKKLIINIFYDLLTCVSMLPTQGKYDLSVWREAHKQPICELPIDFRFFRQFKSYYLYRVCLAWAVLFYFMVPGKIYMNFLYPTVVFFHQIPQNTVIKIGSPYATWFFFKAEVSIPKYFESLLNSALIYAALAPDFIDVSDYLGSVPAVYIFVKAELFLCSGMLQRSELECVVSVDIHTYEESSKRKQFDT